jgi:hypothetical protein
MIQAMIAVCVSAARLIIAPWAIRRYDGVHPLPSLNEIRDVRRKAMVRDSNNRRRKIAVDKMMSDLQSSNRDEVI